MNPPGHFAVACLASRTRATSLVPVVVGTFLPDVVDKSAMLAGLTPYGRTVGHSLVFWGTALALWMFASTRAVPFRRAPFLGSLVQGGILHLGVDLVDDLVEGFQATGYAFSAWMGWPYTNPDMWAWRVPHVLPLARGTHTTTVLEFGTLLVALFLVVRDRRREKRSRAQ